MDTTEPKQKHSLTLMPHHVMAFHKLNMALADFLNQAFDDEQNVAQVRADLMLGQVAIRTLDYLDDVSKPEPALQSAEPNTLDCAQDCKCNHDPIEVAYERYVAHVGGHSERTVSAVPPLALDLILKERFDLILQLHGLEYPKLVVLDSDDNPHIKAWNAARANRRRELQRIGILFFLGWQIPPKTAGVLRQRVEHEVFAVLEYLTNRARRFLDVEQAMAAVIGAQALALTSAEPLDECAGKPSN